MDKPKPTRPSFEIGEIIVHKSWSFGYKIYGKVTGTDVGGAIVYLNDGKENNLMNSGELRYSLDAQRIGVEELLVEANHLARENCFLKKKLSRILSEATIG